MDRQAFYKSLSTFVAHAIDTFEELKREQGEKVARDTLAGAVNSLADELSTAGDLPFPIHSTLLLNYIGALSASLYIDFDELGIGGVIAFKADLPPNFGKSS